MPVFEDFYQAIRDSVYGKQMNAGARRVDSLWARKRAAKSNSRPKLLAVAVGAMAYGLTIDAAAFILEPFDPPDRVETMFYVGETFTFEYDAVDRDPLLERSFARLDKIIAQEGRIELPSNILALARKALAAMRNDEESDLGGQAIQTA